MDKLLWVSHFSGGGGSTLGAMSAGFKHLLGIDFDKKISECYKENIGDIICDDISNVNIFKLNKYIPLEKVRKINKQILVVQTSPPCQEYSVGKTNKDINSDSALILNKTFDFYKIFKPEYVVLENVPSYIKSNPYLSFYKYLINLGYYNSFEQIINCADYGISQTRKRLISIFVQSNFNPPIINKTHNKNNWVSWDNVLKDDFDKLEYTHLSDKQINSVLRYSEPTSLVIVNSKNTRAWGYPTRKENEPIFTLGCSGTLKIAILKNNIIEKVKLVDVKSLAKLQTFPDTYKWTNNKSLNIKIIGNSVPPKLMEIICNAIKTAQDKIIEKSA